MKKRKKSKDLLKAGVVNPVAKYAHRFNRAHVFKDKSKYQRHGKHKGQEPLPMIVSTGIGKGSCYFSALAAQ